MGGEKVAWYSLPMTMHSQKPSTVNIFPSHFHLVSHVASPWVHVPIEKKQ